MSTFTIQICSKLEWKAVLALLSPNSHEVHGYPMGEYFIREIQGNNCIFFHCGIGKTRAGAACQYAIDHWQPGLIIVFGTCGGVQEGLRTLDLVIADRTGQYDCIVRMGEVNALFYAPFLTDIDNSWITRDRIPGAREGFMATADQDLNHELLAALREENVVCADWESAAIAYVAKLNQVSCCIIRGISDIPTEDSEGEARQGQDYRENTPLIMQKLLLEVLPVLINDFSAKAEDLMTWR